MGSERNNTALESEWEEGKTFKIRSQRRSLRKRLLSRDLNDMRPYPEQKEQ